MRLIDTHIHWYSEEFEPDRDEAIARALEAGIEHFLLPAIDSSYEGGMLELVRLYPRQMHLMGGLHPTHVGANYQAELEWVKGFLDQHDCLAVGEIGMDLYWDRTWIREQETAFRVQIGWALERSLPIAIHCREAFDPIFAVLEDFRGAGLRGVFHCFTGDLKQAQRAVNLGFHLGIGGVVTFKNGGLKDYLKELPLEVLVLETDAPYLAPAPFRGKRNEGVYLLRVVEALSLIYGIEPEVIGSRTYANSVALFGI